jgi:hypothetical protein
MQEDEYGMIVDNNSREQRLQNGLCPHCGTRLYKTTSRGIGVMANIALKKKNGVNDSINTSAPEKGMSPLTIPGVVERGQCLRCVDGIKLDSDGVVQHTTVKAVPVSFATHPTFVKMPPQLSELKQPPEKLFASASATSADYLWRNDECDDNSRDEQSLEDCPLLDMNLCRLDGDHASLLNVYDMDDRKPPAKKSPPLYEQAIPTRQDLDLIDVTFDTTQSRGDAATTTTNYEDIDPTFLASLPENLRQEVLNQATTLKTTTTIDTGRGSTTRTRPQAATKSTLSNNHNLSDSFLAALPDNIREEVIAEYESNTERQSNRYTPDSATSSYLSSTTLIDAQIDEDTNDINGSNYDHEMLAAIPEELRIEILKDERNQREQQRLNTSNKPASKVGAVSVDIPAGYDPETFIALPEYMQNELRDDALQQGANNGNHISNENSCASRHNAQLVLAQPIGFEDAINSASCTYEGEYNIYGKRHGNGELRWANGDRYVGQFTDGFIEGKGTLSFHDGKFVLHNQLAYFHHRIMLSLLKNTAGTEYEGQWMKNRFHGHGSRRFSNGNHYTGQYCHGKRQGQGRCYFANGDMFVGDWKDNTMTGFGRYYYNNGHR